VIAFVEVDHNFEETLFASEFFPMIVQEGRAINRNIAAIIFG